MSRQATAAARRAGGHRPAPRAPRRVSGPAARPRRAPAALVARPALAAPGLARVRAFPDSGFVDGLLRSRAWIWLIGVLLGGIVAMQVSLLKLNHGIGRAVESATTLERQNASLEARVARLSSGERIAAVAAEAGMVMPDAGSVRYLSVRADDARRAAARMQEPSDAARAVMQRGGAADPSTLATTGVVAVPGQSAAATTTTTTTAPPETTAPPAPTPTATPAPAATAAPAATVTGGATPGEG